MLVLHAAIVPFVVGGLVATWLGLAMGGRFARSPWFRGFQLAAIAFVVAEAVLGIVCPLTAWEDALLGETTATAASSAGSTRGSVFEASSWRADSLAQLPAVPPGSSLQGTAALHGTAGELVIPWATEICR